MSAIAGLSHSLDDGVLGPSIEEDQLIPIPDDLRLDTCLFPGDSDTADDSCWHQLTPEQLHAYTTYQWQQGWAEQAYFCGGVVNLEQVAYYTAGADAGAATTAAAAAGSCFAAHPGWSYYTPYSGTQAACGQACVLQEQVPFPSSAYAAAQATDMQQHSAAEAAAWQAAYSMQHPQHFCAQQSGGAAQNLQPQKRFPETDTGPFVEEQQQQQQQQRRKKRRRQSRGVVGAGEQPAATPAVPPKDAGVLAGQPAPAAGRQDQQECPKSLLERAGTTIALAFPRQAEVTRADSAPPPQRVQEEAPQAAAGAHETKTAVVEAAVHKTQATRGLAAPAELPALRLGHEQLVTTATGWAVPFHMGAEAVTPSCVLYDAAGGGWHFATGSPALCL